MGLGRVCCRIQGGIFLSVNALARPMVGVGEIICETDAHVLSSPALMCMSLGHQEVLGGGLC